MEWCAQLPKGVSRCGNCQESGQGWPPPLFISPQANRVVTPCSQLLRGHRTWRWWQRPRGDGDQPCFPRSWVKSGGGAAPPVAVTKRCTAFTTAVYTRCIGARAHSAAARPSPSGYRPRGGGTTRQGASAPPEHLLLGLSSRSLPQGWWCTKQGMAVPLWQHPEPDNASFSSAFSPPLQMC